MGQIVRALIEHSLTPEEILDLSQKLEKSSNSMLSGKWTWTNPNFGIDSLFKIWNTKRDDLVSISAWTLEDYPWLEKENFTIDFSIPNIILFDRLLNWGAFLRNENRINEFSELTRAIAGLVKATDMLFVAEISDDFVNAYDTLTVDLFRQHAKTRPYETAIEVR